MSGIFGKGTVLTIGSAIANLTNIGMPSISVADIDVTTHDGDDNYQEFIPGLIDGGEVPVEGYFTDATTANVLLTLLNAGTVTEGATITFPTTPAATWTFDCYVKSYSGSAPHNDKITFSATLKITGKPTLAGAV